MQKTQMLADSFGIIYGHIVNGEVVDLDPKGCC